MAAAQCLEGQAVQAHALSRSDAQIILCFSAGVERQVVTFVAQCCPCERGIPMIVWCPMQRSGRPPRFICLSAIYTAHGHGLVVFVTIRRTSPPRNQLVRARCTHDSQAFLRRSQKRVGLVKVPVRSRNGGAVHTHTRIPKYVLVHEAAPTTDASSAVRDECASRCNAPCHTHALHALLARTQARCLGFRHQRHPPLCCPVFMSGSCCHIVCSLKPGPTPSAKIAAGGRAAGTSRSSSVR